uniref:Uncharacterized protein n=1 Tax=Globodera pallida TaxID=36090 RepID=A0A183CS31_GLOPA
MQFLATSRRLITKLFKNIMALCAMKKTRTLARVARSNDD